MITEPAMAAEKQSSSADLHTEKSDPAHSPKLPPPIADPELQRIAELSAKLENPLSGFSTEDLIQQAQEFCQANHLNDQRKSALSVADLFCLFLPVTLSASTLIQTMDQLEAAPMSMVNPTPCLSYSHTRRVYLPSD
jgi:hypothetical protein